LVLSPDGEKEKKEKNSKESDAERKEESAATEPAAETTKTASGSPDASQETHQTGQDDSSDDVVIAEAQHFQDSLDDDVASPSRPDPTADETATPQEVTDLKQEEEHRTDDDEASRTNADEWVKVEIEQNQTSSPSNPVPAPEVPEVANESRAPWKVSVDLSGYTRDEVIVEHLGKKIKVSGHHVAEGEEHRFARSLPLPDSVDANLVQWEIDGDQLVITAPYAQLF
jgi:HSP20 family molecular chaperone IbpA